MNAPRNIDAWRVAALCEMPPERLHAALTGDGAANWVEAAAKCGLVEAQLRLGRMLLDGTGIDKDEAAAFAWFERAAACGDPDALNMLGRCYENGWGIEASATQAATHYLRAANAGHAWAQYIWPTCCSTGTACRATSREHSIGIDARPVKVTNGR